MIKKFLESCFVILSFFVLCGATYHYVGPKESQLRQRSLDTFGRQMAEKYHLQYIKIGSDRLVENKKVLWSIYFADESNRSIEELRPIVAGIYADFWEKISKDAVYERELRRLAKNDSWQVSRVNPEQMGIKIAFWNNDLQRPSFPYVAQVKIADEKIHYYYADPITHALGEPIVENFEKVITALR